jgi:thioredoxin
MAVVACPKCGAKNRVDPERASHEAPKCGRCGTPLPATLVSGQPVEVTDGTFGAEVLSAGPAPVLVDCWAAWCGPCRMIAPTIDQLAAESAGRYKVAKLDVDANQRTAATYRIDSIPALLIFKGGKLVDQLVGAQPKPVIAATLAKWA